MRLSIHDPPPRDFESLKFSALIRISSALNDFQFLPSLPLRVALAHDKWTILVCPSPDQKHEDRLSLLLSFAD